MSSHEPLTRAGITALAEIPRDVMTFWVRGGVLQPIEAPKGTGNRLSFRWYEANIAAIMNQLRILGVKIEGMLSIGRVYREAITFFEELGLNRDQVHGLWAMFTIEKNFIAGRLKHSSLHAITDFADFERNRDAYIAEVDAPPSDEEMAELQAQMLAAASDVHGAQRLTYEIAQLREKVTLNDFYRHLDPYLTISEQPEPGDTGIDNGHVEELTYFWRVGEGDEYRFAWGAEASDKAREDGALAMIAIDVTAVLYKVWNRDAVGDDEGDGE